MAFDPQTWPYKIRLTIRPEYVPADVNEWTLVFDQDFNPIFQEADSPLAENGPRPMASNGGDLRFTSDQEGNNRLACHVREATKDPDPTLGTLDVAVKIPAVSSSIPTIIWMWWGQPDETQPAATDTYGQYNTYRTSAYTYLPNAYLQDATDPDNSPILDTQGGLVPIDQGAVGAALDSTTGDGMTRYDPERDIMGNAFTAIFAYYKRSKGGGDRGSFLGNNLNNRFGHVATAGDESLHLQVEGTTYSQTPDLANDQWHGVSVKRDGQTWTSRANRVAGTTGDSVNTYELDAIIGIGTTAQRAPDGIADELQIYTEALPNSYIDITQDNLLNTDSPRGIVTWGYIFYPQDIETGAPEVGTSFIAQTHNLGTESIETGLPDINSPRIEEEIILIGENLRTGQPVEGESDIWQRHQLDAIPLETPAPELAESLLRQLHRVGTGEEPVTGAPLIEDSFIAQTHNFIQEGFQTGAPVLEASFIWQTHNIEQDQFVPTTPIVNNSTIGKGHLGIPADLVSEEPIVNDAGFNAERNLAPYDFWAMQSPEIGSPTFIETHHFNTADIETGIPEEEIGVLVNILLDTQAQIQTGAPVTGAVSISQLHIIKQNQTQHAAPILDASDTGQTHVDLKPKSYPPYIKKNGVRFGPRIGSASLEGTSHLTADDLIGEVPKLGTPQAIVVYLLGANGITGEQAVIDTSNLIERYAFESDDIATSPIDISSSELAQTSYVDAEDLVSEAPYIDTAFLIESYSFGGDGLTATPVTLGQSELVMSVSLITGDALTDAPVIGESVIDQIHNIEMGQSVVPAPVLGEPVFFEKEIHELIARGFRGGYPVVFRTGINGFDEPPPIKAPTAGVGAQDVKMSRDSQMVRQIGYLRRYTPSEIRDTWHAAGELTATPETRVYGGGGIYRIDTSGSDMDNAVVLFMSPRFASIDWTKYEITGNNRTPYPRNKETGSRLESAYILLSPEEMQAIEDDLDEDFKSFYVRRQRIPLITG